MTTDPVQSIWWDLLSDTDRQVILRGGYGKRRGLGRRPALIIVDPQFNYAGEDKPILDQIERWPSGVGETAWRAAENIRGLLDAAHARGLPVFYTLHVQQRTGFDAFSEKAERDPSPYLTGAPGTGIIHLLGPGPRDVVIEKSFASAFAGTPLLSRLIRLSIDTLIITGGTTSGCVRALAVDGVSHGFRVAVAADCTYDRISVSHKVGLLDLWMKYCDVVSSEEVMGYMKDLEG